MKQALYINDVERQYKTDLRDRWLKFAVQSIKFFKTIPDDREYQVFKYQFSKAVTSMSADYEEAQGYIQKRTLKLK